MSLVVHSYDRPQRFVVGTVGPPGQRTFFAQARDGARMTSVALEKEQVAVLAQRMDLLLDHVLHLGDPNTEAAVPTEASEQIADSESLEQPIEEEFRVGTMTLGWDNESSLVVVEMFPVSEAESNQVDGDADETTGEAGLGGAVGQVPQEDPASLAESPEPDDPAATASEVFVIKLAPAYAREFVRRATVVVAAGRPPCPFCGAPLSPE
ncbi:MAG: DUF3090 domain-containing protein, partial [Sciscionella sp.]